MHSSTYLAKLLGPVLLAAGLTMLLDPAGFLEIAQRMMSDAGFLYFAGIIALTAGVALVLAHNVWVWDWRLIITLLGWITIIDSLTWMLARRPMQAFWSPLLQDPAAARIGGGVVLLLGLVLSYFGYLASTSTGRLK